MFKKTPWITAYCLGVVFLLAAAALPAVECPPNLDGSDAGLDYLLDDDFYEKDAVKGCANDPFEAVNRVMFTFNDRLYVWVLNPVTTAYSKAVPDDLRLCVKNFFYNLQAPIRLLNSVLQGRFVDALTVVERFGINSTLGVFGLGDPALVDFEIIPVEEAGLGQTMAVWGIDYGFYLYVPFFGPSTLRDFAGSIVDSLTMAPYYIWIDDWHTKIGIYSGKEINELSFHLGEYEELKSLTLDPYIAVRNAYFQYKAKKNAQRASDSTFSNEDEINGTD